MLLCCRICGLRIEYDISNENIDTEDEVGEYAENEHDWSVPSMPDGIYYRNGDIDFEVDGICPTCWDRYGLDDFTQ
jgi:hypothetical protein